jgi:hypothetical protein
MELSKYLILVWLEIWNASGVVAKSWDLLVHLDIWPMKLEKVNPMD